MYNLNILDIKILKIILKDIYYNFLKKEDLCKIFQGERFVYSKQQQW